MMSQESIQAAPASPPAGADASRSLAYAAFATAFAYPDREGLEAIRSGVLADALRQLLGLLVPRLEEDTDWAALRDAGPDDDALQVDFTRLFDAGPDGPDCPMNGSHYGGGETEAKEELVRFYNFFGLSLADGQQEEPDHLITELEFLHYLSYQEAQLIAAGESADGLLRAQRDFIARHPGAWVPAMRQKLVKKNAMRFFPALTELLARFLRAEETRLTERIGQSAEQPELNSPPQGGTLQ
ncbi:hypothetical protein B9N43_05470 [Denitratisoma sp. DHT3]|uniref:molecular chaperone TorD family protein n=1 Tax=Denitratisoma sp. DHT3 TaxID=1981880 RepID=UPI001198AE03|nr:molecular chaperone TorD family protein [Denitratisoma sp. DHT3]QDX80741.1 hypothetical protein B9N43_05470 [Denitratisoma sp. DHT3]